MSDTEQSIWNSKLPTREGPYWHCHYLPPGDKPVICHVGMDSETPMFLCADGSWCPAEKIGGFWVGPIPEPSAPKLSALYAPAIRRLDEMAASIQRDIDMETDPVLRELLMKEYLVCSSASSFLLNAKEQSKPAVVTKRQTGRTMRMIEHARVLASQGKAVYIIAANNREADRIRWLVGRPTNGIKVETEESLSNFNWHTMHLERSWPNCVVLVDHYTIEVRIAAQIEMMTRYDLVADSRE